MAESPARRVMPQLVLQYDEVKCRAASGSRLGNLTDAVQQSHLLEQARSKSSADVAQHDGLARFNSQDMSRIHAHISATADERLYFGHRPRKRGHECARGRLPSSKVLVAL